MLAKARQIEVTQKFETLEAIIQGVVKHAQTSPTGGTENKEVYETNVRALATQIFAVEPDPAAVHLIDPAQAEAFNSVISFLTSLPPSCIDPDLRDNLTRFIYRKLGDSDQNEVNAALNALEKAPSAAATNIKDQGIINFVSKQIRNRGDPPQPPTQSQEANVIRGIGCMSTDAIKYYAEFLFDAFDIGSNNFRAQLAPLVHAAAIAPGQYLSEFLYDAKAHYFSEESDKPDSPAGHFIRYYTNPNDSKIRHTALLVVSMFPPNSKLDLEKPALRALSFGHKELALAALYCVDPTEMPCFGSPYVAANLSSRANRSGIERVLQSLAELITDKAELVTTGGYESSALLAGIGLRIWAEVLSPQSVWAVTLNSVVHGIVLEDTVLPNASLNNGPLVRFNPERFMLFLRNAVTEKADAVRKGPDIDAPQRYQLNDLRFLPPQIIVILCAALDENPDNGRTLRQSWPNAETDYQNLGRMLRALDIATMATLHVEPTVTDAVRNGVRASKGSESPIPTSTSDLAQHPISATSACQIALDYLLAGRLGSEAFTSVCNTISEVDAWDKQSHPMFKLRVSRAIFSNLGREYNALANVEAKDALMSLLSNSENGSAVVEYFAEAARGLSAAPKERARGSASLRKRNLEETQKEIIKRARICNNLVDLLVDFPPSLISETTKAHLKIIARNQPELGSKTAGILTRSQGSA